MRRVTIVPILVALAACSSAPSPEGVQPPAPPPRATSAEPAPSASGARAAPAAAPSAAPAAEAPQHPAPCPEGALPPPAAPWAVFVQDKGCMALFNYNLRNPEPDDVIAVEVYDTHRVTGADVARLRYTQYIGKEKQDVSYREHLPLHVAVTAKGLYVLDAEADESVVTAALKKPPTYTHPPRIVKPTKGNNYRYVTVVKTPRGEVTCFGHAHPRDGSCEDTCTGEVCISPTKGVVSLGGTASPSFEFFAQEGFDGRE
ncbi:hypothetical protein [Sorangium sp. So ce145]|uniref:hypothetical protein n=1 Tax=Sorangium sp. So ce145 TaxID=3133285 RepID=UPI003F645AB5